MFFSCPIHTPLSVAALQRSLNGKLLYMPFAHTDKMHWVGTAAIVVICVILEVLLSSTVLVMQYKHRHLLSFLTEAV